MANETATFSLKIDADAEPALESAAALEKYRASIQKSQEALAAYRKSQSLLKGSSAEVVDAKAKLRAAIELEKGKISASNLRNLEARRVLRQALEGAEEDDRGHALGTEGHRVRRRAAEGPARALRGVRGHHARPGDGLGCVRGGDRRGRGRASLGRRCPRQPHAEVHRVAPDDGRREPEPRPHARGLHRQRCGVGQARLHHRSHPRGGLTHDRGS